MLLWGILESQYTSGMAGEDGSELEGILVPNLAQKENLVRG